ncbi:MAG: hypothetical protein FIB02_01690 [Desulfuromonas sp.]|nr:hypothetical protein [Desulfuromonas sp.]
MTTAADAVLWEKTLTRVRRELAELPVAEHDWLVALTSQIGELQVALDRLFLEVDGSAICTDCLGGCCSRAKHHVTLTNVLGYLLRGEEPPTPDFTLACPLLGAQGCRLPVARRPFNCIIFLCERIDAQLTDEQRTTFSKIEAELRNAYHAVAERCPGASLRGLLISAERVGEQRLLTR